ncbi:MAG: preprotein translocase subunit SecE, partial [Chloroflexaceae bacterium]
RPSDGSSLDYPQFSIPNRNRAMAVAKDIKEQRENAIVRTFRETRSELRKVVWPTREETIRLTIVVITVSVIIGLILFIGDSLFLFLYTALVDLLS